MMEKMKDNKMSLELTKEEAEIICDFIEDEQNCGSYEQYWSEDQRKALDEVLYKIKVGLRDGEQ